MDAADGSVIVAIVALAIVLFVTAQHDLVVPWLLEKVFEPSLRWFQRVCFGIYKVRAGPESLIGHVAPAMEFHKQEEGQYTGSVRVGGETWRAKSTCQILEGTQVRIVSREGLTLLVEPAEDHRNAA